MNICKKEGYFLKVTIITVVYNDETRIASTLQSINDQDFKDIEYIIIDGASTDSTLQIIHESNVKVDKLISEPDKGIYDAMNKGVQHATGKWIIFLNAGDTFYSENTLNEIFAVKNIDKYDVIYGRHMWNYDIFKKESTKRPLKLMYKTMPFCHQASLTKREWLLEYPFDLRYKLIADYDFFRKVYFKGAKFLYRPVIIANYLCTGGASGDNLLKVYKENFLITNNINIVIRIFWFLKKVLKYYITKFIKFLMPQSLVNTIRKRI